MTPLYTQRETSCPGQGEKSPVPSTSPLRAERNCGRVSHPRRSRHHGTTSLGLRQRCRGREKCSSSQLGRRGTTPETAHRAGSPTVRAARGRARTGHRGRPPPASDLGRPIPSPRPACLSIRWAGSPGTGGGVDEFRDTGPLDPSPEPVDLGVNSVSKNNAPTEESGVN